jgi:hypothetical protein
LAWQVSGAGVDQTIAQLFVYGGAWLARAFWPRSSRNYPRLHAFPH